MSTQNKKQTNLIRKRQRKRRTGNEAKCISASPERISVRNVLVKTGLIMKFMYYSDYKTHTRKNKKNLYNSNNE